MNTNEIILKIVDENKKLLNYYVHFNCSVLIPEFKFNYIDQTKIDSVTGY